MSSGRWVQRRCTVCSHPKVGEINRALAEQTASRSRIARTYGLRDRRLRWHEARHLDPVLIEAAKAKVSENGKGLVERVSRMVDRLEALADNCADQGTGKDLLAVARELRPYHELFGRAVGELQNDKVSALFVTLGVRSEDDLRAKLSVAQRVDSLTTDEAFGEMMAGLKDVFAVDPAKRTLALELIGRWSYAEEATNGKANGQAALPE